MFKRIADLMIPKSRLRPELYDGIDQKYLATLDEAKELQQLILENIKLAKWSQFIRSVGIVAVAGAAKAVYVPGETLFEERFPANIPIHVFVEVEQGPDRPTADDIEGDYNPAKTLGQVMFNVRKTAEILIKDQDTGVQRIFDEINRAYEDGQAKAAGLRNQEPNAAPDEEKPVGPVSGKRAQSGK